MSQGKCLHNPRRLIASGAKHKDGTPVMICADCKSTSQRQSRNRKIGYDAMFDAQGGMCAFCRKPLADDNTTHREHNHRTGEERGLVHARCNLMIGGIENAAAVLGLDALVRWMRANIT